MLNSALVPVRALLDRLTVLFVRVSLDDIVGTVVPHDCNLPVPLGTRLMFIFVLLPVAVSVIVPVPPAT